MSLTARTPFVAPLAVCGCLLLACVHRDPPRSSGGSAMGTRPCDGPDSTHRSSVQREGLPGEYRLTLVATSGALAGRSSSGSLNLGPRFGRAAIDLATVGAVAPGDIASADSAAPGVLVVESPNATGAGSLILRFGADANRSDRQPFDGAHMALFVDAVSPSGINGRWTSGVATRSAAGYFCAERLGR